jgi:hypothetical protein
MRRASIFVILLSVILSACGGESGASYSTADKSGSSGGGMARRNSEEAIVTMESAEMPVSAPQMEPAAPPSPSGAQQPTFTVSDSGGVPPGPGAPGVSLNPMLIRTGTATVQVDSLEQGIAQVRGLAQRVGGIVGNTTINSGAETVRSAVVELRIPSASFDRAVTGLAPIGRVEQVNVTAEDVGEEFTDVTARVANARRLEARLLDLLERRTGRLEEVLNLERELARVREEIERYEGRLRYLRTRTSVSVLTITLHEPHQIIGQPGDRPIRDAFGDAWRNFVELVAGAIAASGILIPLALLAYAAWRVLRRVRRRALERDAAYREALRRERERKSAPEATAEEPAEGPVARG